MLINIIVNESVTLDWDVLEHRFGKMGTPGFTKLEFPLKAPHMIKNSLEVNAKADLYRKEDGQLVCVYISYIEDGVVKPFVLMVHPDYQRQGIATMVINNSREQFASEQRREYNLEQGLSNLNDMRPSQAIANWLNKYIENIN